MIKLLSVEDDCCHECNEHRQGVRFRLFREKSNISFLCWSCFCPAMTVLLDLGVLYRHPREPEVFTVIQRGPSPPEGQDWPGGTEPTGPTERPSAGRGSAASDSRRRSRPAAGPDASP